MENKDDHKFDGKEDRNYHQKPFDDNTDPLGQMDDASATIADRGTDKSPESPDPEIEKPAPRTQINEDDERDQGDSTRDWDAEQSRTSRNK